MDNLLCGDHHAAESPTPDLREAAGDYEAAPSCLAATGLNEDCELQIFDSNTYCSGSSHVTASRAGTCTINTLLYVCNLSHRPSFPLPVTVEAVPVVLPAQLCVNYGDLHHSRLPSQVCGQKRLGGQGP